MLREAERIVALLPAEQAGTCVMDANGELFRGAPDSLGAALTAGSLRYHRGSIRGAWPRVVDRSEPF